MAPPQPSPNAPLVMPSLPNAAEFRMAAKSVSDSWSGTVGGTLHTPAFFFIVLVLGAVSLYVRRVKGGQKSPSPQSARSRKGEKSFELVGNLGKQWTKQKIRAD